MASTPEQQEALSVANNKIAEAVTHALSDPQVTDKATVEKAKSLFDKAAALVTEI